MSWNELLAGSGMLWISTAAIACAVAIATWVFIVPSRAIPVDRRRYGVVATPSPLTKATDRSMGVIARVLARRQGGTESAAHALDLAGIKRSVPEFVLLLGAVTLAGAAIGLLIGGPLVAIMLAALAVVGAFMVVNFRANKRRSDFEDQLDDLVQLLGSNMRAGHSVLQAMDSVSRELEEPGSSEIARVVNQVRVGRDIGEALDETGERMDSDDFRWIAQAIAIHRQVGGNLAEVMDTVGETIRERNQIRRQVVALSAEGKLSAYILVALPFFVVLILAFMNPAYIGRLTEGPIGYGIIVTSIVLLSVGSWWLSKIVKIKF